MRVRHRWFDRWGTAKATHSKDIVFVDWDNPLKPSGYYVVIDLIFRVPARTAPLTLMQGIQHGIVKVAGVDTSKLLEGWDTPEPMYLQQVGRGLRAVPNDIFASVVYHDSWDSLDEAKRHEASRRDWFDGKKRQWPED